jgi:arsenate reductase-like glutaredoxin family protein
MAENEAMIKRPIFDLEGNWAIGFAKKDQEILKEKLL